MTEPPRKQTQTASSSPPSQDGRTAIVTGATGGIGLWTAIGLARAGAHVIMVCRDPHRGEDARAMVTKMRAKTGCGRRRFRKPDGGARRSR